ncbi:NAD(P)-binding protein [Dichomitus squalens]|uniref:NAD(P)-binding protein n=1 Tax=Dichomitus squalens TaxID=114155 RepID=A0A4Q9PS47_9APHY|nr:NAD(P)-binding protein [Dichomitus squalens]
MAPIKNGRVIFNEIPTGYPVPGKTTVYDESETIDLDIVTLNGGILVKILALAVDPYLRRKMIDPKIPSFFPPWGVGQVLDNNGVGVVLRSEDPAYKVGSHVRGHFPFQQYVVLHDPSQVGTHVLENKGNLPWSVHLGVLGMPGRTAHHGWSEFSHFKKGDVVFVTAASGPVGATVVQIAKAEGLKVIASAGSDEKVEFVKSIGADVAFNYKTTKTREVLEKEGFINIYWDNVGGESLEAALEFAAQKAHFIICGNISGYNTPDPYHVKNLQQLVWREITFHGFLIVSLLAKYQEEFDRTFPARVASGEIKYKEHIVRGLENAGQGLVDVLTGKNFGKCVLVVAAE